MASQDISCCVVPQGFSRTVAISQTCISAPRHSRSHWTTLLYSRRDRWTVGGKSYNQDIAKLKWVIYCCHSRGRSGKFVWYMLRLKQNSACPPTRRLGRKFHNILGTAPDDPKLCLHLGTSASRRPSPHPIECPQHYSRPFLPLVGFTASSAGRLLHVRLKPKQELDAIKHIVP